ncbi:MAG: acyltransferase [Eubacteriales bacterium]|nr:acyltransferase [Eubacteriales bacterium]
MKKQRLLHTIGLMMRKGSGARGDYLRDRHIMAYVGENVRFQPRLIPLYPELIKLHNNIMVAAGVRFVTHDASYAVLNKLDKGYFPERIGCIEVMDNVFIGYNVTILPNVKIGNNCIIGACATVTKDLEPNGVYVGSPARRIGSFDDFVKECSKREDGYAYPYIRINQNISAEEVENAWQFFAKVHDI